jgi:hypothetical protein
MKRKLSFVCFSIVLGFLLTNCGPSAKEFKEKRVSDLIRVSDSLVMTTGISNKLNLSTRTPDDKKFIKTAETKFMVSNAPWLTAGSCLSIFLFSCSGSGGSLCWPPVES